MKLTFPSFSKAALFLALPVLIFFASLSTAQAVELPTGHTTKAEETNSKKGEKERKLILNEQKEPVSRVIEYLDGKHRVQTLRKDGTVSAETLTSKNGSTEERSYYPNGRLMRESKNGVRLFERRKLADETYEAIRYKDDGKSPQMLRRIEPRGEFEIAHYRTDSSNVWFKINIPGTSGHFEYQYFPEDGSRLRRVLNDDNNTMIVTAYDKNGDFWFEQVWQKNDDGSYTLLSLTTPHLSAMRRYVLSKDGKTVETVQDLSLAGDVEKSQALDANNKPDGTLLKEAFENDDPTIPDNED